MEGRHPHTWRWGRQQQYDQTDYNLDHYDSEDDDDSDSEDDGNDDAGANDPQPIAGVEHNNNNRINEEDNAEL